MIDLQPKTIKKIFEQQILNMTTKTVIRDKENTFDFQLSGGWLK
jgi:hypothetical protein